MTDAVGPFTEPIAYTTAGEVERVRKGLTTKLVTSTSPARAKTGVPLYLVPSAPTVKVKSLDWIGGDARSFAGEYAIYDLGGCWREDRFELQFHDDRIGRFPDEATAKVCAQAHHERTTLDAIEIVGGLAIPLKLLREAHAVMRACGWHNAPGSATQSDGVLEAAAAEIEGKFHDLLKMDNSDDHA